MAVVLTLDVDVGSANRDSLLVALEESRQVRARLDRFDIDVAARLAALAAESPAIFPERVVADATKVSLVEAARQFERAKTLETIPELGEMLAAGAGSAGHVDIVTRALRDLKAADKQRLAESGHLLAGAAASQSRDEFAKTVRRRVRQLASGDGLARLERQKQATRMRTWIDRESGMWCVRGEFDPERGLILETQLQARVEQLFHDKTPSECPTDPLAKQQYLRAMAFMDLCAGRAGRQRTELIMLIDSKTLLEGEHAATLIDLGIDVDLPVETVRRMASATEVITPVVTAANGINLHLGKDKRLASKDQRRLLRVMYPTCAMPGCEVPFAKTQIHHITYFGSRNGRTDIDDEVPICNPEHHNLHKGQFALGIDEYRNLTVTMPDGTTMTTGPPKRRAG